MAYTQEDVAKKLRDLGVSEHVIGDEAGYLAGKYSDSDEDLDKVIQQSLSTYQQRGQSGGDRSQGGFDTRLDDVDGDGTGGSPRRDGGVAVTQQQLDQLFNAIQGMNAQPDVDMSQFQPGDFPVFEVPGEDLGPFIDDTLLDVMEGFDPLDLQGRLTELLDRTQGGSSGSQMPNFSPRQMSEVPRPAGYTPPSGTWGSGSQTPGLTANSSTAGMPTGDSRRLQIRREMARSNLDRGLETSIEQLRSILADRGLISMPGAPQGPELDMTERWTLPIQREFLQELRTSELEEQDRADLAERDALSRATGWTNEQINARLGAARTGQEREQMKSSIALQVLSKNMEWNRFLAEFGLSREQLAEDIRRGRMQDVQALMAQFLALINASRGGFI